MVCYQCQKWYAHVTISGGRSVRYAVSLFRHEVDLFCHEVGLFRHEVGLFRREVGLFQKYYVPNSVSYRRFPVWSAVFK